MKTPVPPPAPLGVLKRQLLMSEASPQRMLDLVTRPELVKDREYHPWEWFFRHEPPSGFTREEWWTAVRWKREETARPLPLRLTSGTPLSFNLPDPLLELLEEITARTKGQIELPEPVTNPTTRNRYLVSSLMEEAVTSSQLEGASTSRVVAKRMLREGRTPTNRSERMIVNNYLAMLRIIELKDEPLSPELIMEIHRRVTEGTLDDPSEAGRMQAPSEERVRIYGDIANEQVLHVPPPAEELEERMSALCAFANSEKSADTGYVPPLIRAVALHFMMGYDHYFADGNGRTSRAVFYWSMLHQGFFLAEFLSLSRLFRAAPAKYARTFLLTEQDEGDLTHFLLEHARFLMRAIEELDAYLALKTRSLTTLGRALRATDLNHRQIAVLESFMRDPGGCMTVAQHSATQGVVKQTARTDLQDLESRGFLLSARRGRSVTWFPVDDLADRIKGRSR